MKTSELIGAALDWAVAMAHGWIVYPTDSVEQGQWYHTNPDVAPRGFEHNRVHVSSFTPSTDWLQGGLIIDREGIGFYKGNATKWWAQPYGDAYTQEGQTALIAAMRCYVASKLGDDVNIPSELL